MTDISEQLQDFDPTPEAPVDYIALAEHFTTKAVLKTNSPYLYANDTQLRALAFNALGFNTIRAQGKKVTESWAKWIRKKQSAYQTEKMFEGYDAEGKKYDTYNLAIVCGTALKDGWYYAEADCDTEESYKYAKSLFKCAGIKTWHYKTGRGGRIGFLTALPCRGTKENEHGIAIRGYGQYVIAPGSRHDSGKMYEFEYSDQIAHLNWNTIPELGLTPAFECKDRIPAYPGDRVMKLLNGQYFLAKDKQNAGTYKSRSEAEYTAILILVDKKFSLTQIEYLFDSYTSKKSHYQGLSVADRIRFLRQAVHRAEAYLKEHAESEIKQQLKEFKEQVYSHNLLYRGGRLDQLVLLVHIKQAENLNSLEYHLSATEIAKRTGYTPQAIDKSHKRILNRFKILKIVHKHTYRQATVWRLDLTCVGTIFNSTPVCKRVPTLDLLVLKATDAFFFRSGLTSVNVYSCLSENWQRVADVGKNSGYSWSTNKKRLEWLVENGLAEKQGKRYNIIPIFDQLDRIAKTYHRYGSMQKHALALDEHRSKRLINMLAEKREVFSTKTGLEIE